MNISYCKQGSDEWLKARLGIPTASNFSKIITSTGKESATLEKYAFDLATDTLLSKVEESYKNANMQRGNDLEAEARQAYIEAQDIFITVEECGFITNNQFLYSPDGLVGEDGLIEIKCPLAKTHFGYILDDKCPSEYYAQCQGGLFITGRKWIDFVSYHPDFKRPLFIKRIERDEEFIGKLKELAQKTIVLRDEILSKIK